MMADNVQWIRFKVGTFDGNSFKRIKRARIEGVVNFRDKLTAVWFELLDLGGKVNNNGFLMNEEIAFISYEDIAIALDRSEEEIKLCIDWYIKNEMMDITDNVYLISNWTKYQNNDGLDKIRENNRLRQQRYREKNKQVLLDMKDSNVTVTLRNALSLKDNNISKSNSLSNSISYFEDLELNSTFEEFMKMRKTKIKNGGMTERAISMMVNKLNKYDIEIAIKMLEQSIINNWKDIYELKNDNDNKPKTKQQLIDDDKNSQFQEIARERGYVK
jgi:predicted phage replisome organizer